MIEYLVLVQNDEHEDIFMTYHYLKQFNKGNCSYTLMIHNPQMLKFVLYNIDWKQTEYIFVPRDKIGIAILLDICTKIMNYPNTKK